MTVYEQHCSAVAGRCGTGHLLPVTAPPALLCLIVVTACYLFSFRRLCSVVLVSFWTNAASRQGKRSDDPVTGKTLSTHFDSLILLVLL